MSGKIRQRLARVGAFWLGAAACADVLGLPDHPRLVQDAAAPPRGQRMALPESELESSDAGQRAALGTDAGVLAAAGEEPAASSLNGSSQRPARTSSASSRETQTPDAGVGSVQPPPADILALPAAALRACAAPAVLGPDGICYAALTTLLSWPEASQGCRAIGAGWQLASIRSAEINQFVTRLVAGDSWIGASDASAEGNWIWTDDGTAFWNGDDGGSGVAGAFVNWGGTEPNGEDGSNCARLVPQDLGVWADFECEERINAVCAGPPG